MKGLAPLFSLAAFLVFFSARAETITLLNGVTMTGDLVSVTADGLEFNPGEKARMIPWPAIAPGTRFRLDPSYRQNLSGYLAGAERTTLTNQFDETTTATSESTPPKISGAGLAGNFAPAEPLILSNLNVTSEIPLTNLVVWAFQFGPGARDVALYGFPRDNQTRLVQLKMPSTRTIIREATTAGETNLFAADEFTAQLGDATLKTKLAWSVTRTERFLSAEISVIAEGRTIAFSHDGRPSGLTTSDQPLYPRPLIAAPQLEFVPRIEQGALAGRGRIRMGSLTFYPDGGLGTSIKIAVRENTSGPLIEETFSPANRERYPLRFNANTLRPGQSYTLTASTDLGPWLGRIEHEQPFVIPDNAGNF